jgi:hypothetical protein
MNSIFLAGKFEFWREILMLAGKLLRSFPVMQLPVIFGDVTHYSEFEDTKGIIRIHISKKNRQRNGQKGQKDKQRSTKQHI